MIVVLADTHSRHGHELEGAVREHATAADLLVHAGDFTSQAALEAVERVTDRLVAVCGNADDPAVTGRLPERRTVDHDGVRIALTHRPTGGEAGLAAYGRAEGADVVVFGHTHRPTLQEGGDMVLLNPGSHARPRGSRPGFATLARDGETLRCALRGTDGAVVESIERRSGGGR